MPEGLTLNGLSLNNGTTHILTELQLPIPAKKPEWVEGADANGAVLMRDPLVENGTLVCKLDLYTASKDAANAAIGAIIDELEEADRNPAGIPVVWTPVNGTKSLTFYALSGEVTELPMDTKAVDANVPTVQITLKCRPGGYGPLVTGPSQTTAGPVVQLTVPDVPGDMPTDEAYIVITDTSSQARRHVEWGAEWLHYNHGSPWSLVLDSDSLVVSGFAGTLVTATLSGGPNDPNVYDPNATGATVVQAPAYAQPVAMCGTGSLTHKGSFRVKARVRGNAIYRFCWAVGDGQFTTGDWATPTWGAASDEWYEIDLGLVTIPPVTAGTQSWQGRVEVQMHPSNPSNAIYNTWLDYLTLVPMEAGYGRARTTGTIIRGAVTAFDNFGAGTGNLHGQALDLGGTWTTAGSDATDFTANSGLNYAIRFATVDANSLARFAVPATTYTDVHVACDIQFPGNPIVAGATVAQFEGVVARWVDQSNWCAAGRFADPGTPGRLAFAVCVAGSVGYYYGAGLDPVLASANTWWTVGLSVSAAGEYTVSLNDNPRFSGMHTALASGGALASGKCGIYDVMRDAVAVERWFTNFQVSQVAVPAPVVYSGRTFEVTAAEARRQNSAGTVYGRPGSYRGSRFILNPAGSADRVTRVAAKAHRNDPDIGAPITTGLADQLKLQVFYRPKFSVVPR